MVHIGCFAHYATLRQHDVNFSRHEKANEWLVTFDILSAGMYSNGDFALSPYLPYTLVPFYPLFQERGGQRVERNQADWEVSPVYAAPCPTHTDNTVIESPIDSRKRRSFEISV